MTEKKLKPLRGYTIGDFAIVGLLLALVVTAFLLAGLVMSGVIMKEPAAPLPTPTPAPTVSPTPAPELLGGEDRRACGLYWETYEWALITVEKGDTVRYFTNDLTIDDTFLTMRDGCRLEDYPTPFRNDDHKNFDVEQFRIGEVDLFHWSVIAEKKAE